jgi:hypothetical protein
MLARVLGGLFLLLAVVAFIPNPLVGAIGYFRTDAILNGVFAFFGLLLLAFTGKGESTAASGLYLVGMLSLACALVGYMQLSEYPSGVAVKLFDLVTCNQEDVWLMAGAAGVLTVCGMMNTSSGQIIRD